MKYPTVASYIFLQLIVHMSAYNISQLYRDLFDGTYNMYEPPNIPTDIGVEVQLEEIQNINDVSETIAVRIRIHSWWYDDRFLWNNTEYNGLNKIQVPPSLVWTPDLALINSATDMTITGSEASPITAQLLTTRGRVQMQWSPVGNFETKCDFDLTFYPYDYQKCEVQIGTLGSSNAFIKFSTGKCIKLANLQTSTWSIQAVSSNVSEFQFDYAVVKKKHVLTCTYTLRRKSTFYFINLILPLLFLGFMTPFAFLIPNEGGEKVSFVITLFLAFTVHETIIMANVPLSSDKITYLQIFIVIQLVFTVFVLIVSIVQSRIFHVYKLEQGGKPEGFKQRLNAVTCKGKSDIVLFVSTFVAQVICNTFFLLSVTRDTYT